MKRGMAKAKWWKRALGKAGRERATALVTQGVVHAREGRLVEARRAYEAAVDADDSLGVAHLNLGLCRLDLYNRALAARAEGAAVEDEPALEEIIVPLRRALALEPQHVVGWRALARVEERCESWAAAFDAWGEVEARAPDDSPEKKEARERRRSLERKAAADRARRRALAALEADVPVEDKRAALEELMPFVDEPGLVARGHALAGTLSRRAGDRDQARALLERAAADDKADVDTLREIASICMEEGDLRRALAASIDAYRERPTDGGLVCNVGVCHLGLGDVEKAAEFIELAHQLEPKDPIVVRAREALERARAGAPRE